MNSKTMKELVEVIAKALVDNPGDVNVAEIGGGTTRMLELRVANSDLGKIIGKQGRNIGAIRQILNAASAKKSQRVVLEIIE